MRSVFLDFGTVNMYMINLDQLAFLQLIKVKSQRSNIHCKFIGFFFEGHENTRLTILHGAPDNKF